jgi:hypothetical protein
VDAETLLAQRVGAAGHLPLVVIGDNRRLNAFRRRSGHSDDLIAEVARSRLKRAPIKDLAAKAVDRWLSLQRLQAVTELQDAESHDRLAWGIEAAWSALESRSADRLWVEHNYGVPGRVVTGIYGVEKTNDPAEPGVIDDLVDALIARAGELGVPVDLLDPGALMRAEPVAARVPLTSVPSPGSPWDGRPRARSSS